MAPNDIELAVLSDEYEEPESDKLTKEILLLAFFSALGGFLFGYDTGVVSGAMILIRKEFMLTTLWQELIVSVTVAAAWVSSLVAGQAADHGGRQKVILISSVVFAVGALIMAFAPNKETLLVGRITVGVAIGFSSMCIPVYLSEISPVSARGRITVTNILFLTGGQFIASVTAGIFSGTSEGWRWMLGLGAVPAVIQFFAFLFAPESPRWLSWRGRLDEAHKVLIKFRRNMATVEAEMDMYATQLKSDEELSGMRSIFEIPPVRRALILGCLLQLFQQISGINTVMYYSASIIAMAGVDNDQTAIWLTAVTSFFNFSFTFVGLWLVERVGRRLLTLGSLAGVSIALLSLALSFHLVYLNSPPVTSHYNTTQCSHYEYCSTCTRNADCGFCFYSSGGTVNESSCLTSNHSSYDEVSVEGSCAGSDSAATFAHDWCPSDYSWLSILGLCLYLCFFAPGMGPMPWSINSEIYPNWARANATAIATSVNWAANLIVALTFLSLTEAITKHGTFYLYMGLAFTGFLTFFFILPETKGIPLEEVEHIFKEPLYLLKPWRRRRE